MARHRKSNYVFGQIPLLRHSRSMFDLSHRHLTSVNAAELIPFMCEEVLPGDTFKVKSNFVARVTSAMLKPVMDNAFLDMFFFFVPNRLVFDQWEQVFGSASPNQWVTPQVVDVPFITGINSTDDTVTVGTLADHFGIPSNLTAEQLLADGGVSALRFRAYAKIYEDWFRNENLIDPMNIQTGSISDSEDLNNSPFTADNYTGMPAIISKVKDYFTQLLPAPQKGASVQIGTVVFPETSIPIVTGSAHNVNSGNSMVFSTISGNFSTSGIKTLGFSTGSGNSQSEPVFAMPNAGTSNTDFVYPSNLYANIGETSLNATDVNDLRLAFQMQKLLERDARSGSRYREYLLSAFGVSSADSRLQVSEYLGGSRIPLSIFQTVQTSESTSGNPLGNVAGFSLSNGRAGFSKSFTEHGHIIGLCAIRQYHTYQQGIHRSFFRRVRSDFYDPIFQSIGEQPVYTREIYAAVGSSSQILGYNPAWEEYRFGKNLVTGQLNSVANTGLDIWHFADEYENAPVLGQQFIQETPDYIDRTLAVSQSVANQFILDFWNDIKAVRVMPTYSVPSLIDHH